MKSESLLIFFEKWGVVLVAGCLWLVGFVYNTGVGTRFHVYEITSLLIVILFVLRTVFFSSYRKFDRYFIFLFLFLALCALYHEICFNRNLLSYFCLFLLIPLMSQLYIGKRQMKAISLLFFLGGFSILLLANYTKLFSGWDENSISIPAFFSYTVFAVSFGETRDWRKITVFVVASLVYYYLLFNLGSRSAILFSLFLSLSVFSVIPMKSFIKKRSFMLFLLFPLLVAIVIVLIRNTGFLKSMESWSKDVLHEGFLNGRDEIWTSGFRIWMKTPLLGNGSFEGNLHNSAVTLLIGVGAIGFLLYLGVIYFLLRKSSQYSNDYIIRGLILAYITIWMQQSVELGLVANRGSVIPFVILGLLVARVRTLEKEKQAQNIYNYSSL